MKHLLAYWGLRTGVGLVGILPESAARAVGGMVGKTWHTFDGKRRRMATRHMKRVLGDGADPAKASQHVMESYGRYFAEALWARGHKVAAMLENTTVEGLEMVVAARDAGTGAIYALPHLGNWEAAAPVSLRIGVPVVAVAEALPNQRITEWFTAMRAEFGIEIVLATGRIEVMRKLEQAIADNKAVALLSDRDLKGRGIEVEFFGEQTTLPAGPATLALKTGAPLFPVATYFRDDGHHVVIRPPIEVPEGKRGDVVRAVTQSLARAFEKLILEEPDQWHLVVPNWPSDQEE